MIIPWWGLILITAVIVAIVNIIKKHLLSNEHALEQLAAEVPFHLLAILFLIPIVEIPTLAEATMILFTAGVLFLTHLYRNKSYRHLPISTVSPLMNLSPLFLFIIAVGFLGERITNAQLLGVCLLMAGGYLLDLKTRDWLAPLKSAAKSKHSVTVIATLIFISIMGSLDKVNIQELGIPVFSYLFWLYLIYSTFTLALHTKQYGHQTTIKNIKKHPGWLMLTGFLGVAQIALLYYTLSLPGVLIILVVPLRRTATLIETLVGGAIFHEKHLLQRSLASLIMVAGVLFII